MVCAGVGGGLYFLRPRLSLLLLFLLLGLGRSPTIHRRCVATAPEYCAQALVAVGKAARATIRGQQSVNGSEVSAVSYLEALIASIGAFPGVVIRCACGGCAFVWRI